ncbi:MAG TPA: UvrB/UvrC motif-containing protein [bacterium]|nr:UvrB/UvrC motif-containing protein [bacterium]HPR87371.1 UvrB/UvrC motif-containing protein [bacterium]
MTDDIGPMLKKWRYTPDDIHVRLIRGEDGRDKLQLRLDLGLLQMELDGRPDGRRPHRFESYYKYCLHRARLAEKQEGRHLDLTPIDCWLLQQEAVQFYHRYLALMRLGDYPRVIRDTVRNLHVLDFVGQHTSNDEIIWSFEQYRPFVIMMNTRACASQSMEFQDFDKALEHIRQGSTRLRKFYRTHSARLGEERLELDLLQEWAVEIKGKRPLSDREHLARELRQAISKEEYERAALLRDMLGELEKPSGQE